MLDSGAVTVNGANVTTTDLTAGNGVVHVINAGEFQWAAPSPECYNATLTPIIVLSSAASRGRRHRS